MPTPLAGHSSLTHGNNLLVLGGGFGGFDHLLSASIFKLTCSFGEFTWEEMEEKLQTARKDFVADFIPD